MLFDWNSKNGRGSCHWVAPASSRYTFWFQAICPNHIVWDAVDVVEFIRKPRDERSDSRGSSRRRIVEQVESPRMDAGIE